MGTDQFAELVSAVVRAVPRDLDTTLAQAWIMDQDSLMAVLRTIMMKLPEETPVLRPQTSTSYEIATRYGFMIVEDDGPTAFNVATLKPRAFLRGREQSINGAELRKRAIELKGNLSLVDGQRIVDEQATNPVPAEFAGLYIPLTGTLLRRFERDDLYFACLDFYQNRWQINFSRLGVDCSNDGCLACTE